MSEELYLSHGLRAQLPEPFDNSMKSEYVRCQRKFWIRYCLGRIPKVTKHGRTWGTAWHKVQEVFSFVDLEHGAAAAVDAAFATIDDYLPEVVDDRYGRDRSRMKQAFSEYVEKFYAADKQQTELVRAEQPFEVFCPAGADCPWGGCDLAHAGKTDKIVRRTGKLWVHDYKTSTQKDDYYHNKIILDPQTTGYLWANSHLLGERVWGVLIDRATVNKSAMDFQRYPLSVSDDLVVEWITEQRLIDVEIRGKFDEAPYDMSAWRRNPEECHTWGGCPYFDVCSLPAFPDIDSRLLTLENEFDVRRHDVYKL